MTKITYDNNTEKMSIEFRDYADINETIVNIKRLLLAAGYLAEDIQQGMKENA